MTAFKQQTIIYMRKLRTEGIWVPHCRTDNNATNPVNKKITNE
jgi:hypothetical protein